MAGDRWLPLPQAPGDPNAATSPPSQKLKDLNLKVARLIVPFDVMRQQTQIDQVTDWLNKVTAAHYDPLISFNHSLSQCDQPVPLQPCRAPSRGKYLYWTSRFVQAFTVGTKQVHWYTAWNEPNGRHQPTGPFQYYTDTNPPGEPFSGLAANPGNPKLAADYFRKLTTYCNTTANKQCAVAAGDFATARHGYAQLRNYVSAYIKRIGSSNAGRVWAIHPYAAGLQVAAGHKNRAMAPLNPFLKLIPNAPRALWFTEAGGIVQQGGHRFTGRQADLAVDWLVNTLVRKTGDPVAGSSQTVPKITRFYYFHLADNPAPPPDGWDSGLFTPAQGDGPPQPDPDYTPRKTYCTYWGATTEAAASDIAACKTNAP
jgi:hypothetical protein